MNEQLPVETSRLLLRPFNSADATTVQRLAGVREVSDMTEAIPYPYEDGMAEAWIATHAECWNRKTTVTYAVCDKTDEQLIGCVGLTISVKHHKASLGYWMGVDFWGNGFCTEASAAALAFGFDTLKLKRIEAIHLSFNMASGAVMKKIGMQHEGTHRAYVLKNGVFENVERYAIVAEDRA